MRQENQKPNQQSNQQNSAPKSKNNQPNPPSSEGKSSENRSSQQSSNTTKYLIIGLVAAVAVGYLAVNLNQPSAPTPPAEQYGALSHNAIKESLPIAEDIQDLDQNQQSADNDSIDRAPAYNTSITSDAATPGDSSDADMTQLMQVTNAQLKALANHNISKAYQDYTTKEFKQATSYDAFSQTVQDNPVLSDYSKVDYDPKSLVIDKNRATITAVVQKGRDSVMVDYSLIKIDGSWKIWGLQIRETHPSQSAKQERSPEEQEVTDAVEAELNLIKNNDLSKAYYNNTASEFQRITPYPAFQVFVGNYPVMSQYRTINFSDVSFDKGKASVMATLQAGENSLPVEFTLSQEGGQWKIYGFRVKSEDQTQITSSDKGEIQSVINDQLSALKSNDLEKAYDYSSSEFRESTSPRSFQEFIKHYPLIQTGSASFSSPVQTNQTVAVTVTFNSQGNSANVEYRMVKEDGQWKIWKMNVIRNNANTASRPATMKSADLQNVIESQLAALRQHNVNKAYQSYTSKAFKESTSLTSFQSFVDKNPVLTDNTGASFGSLSFDNDIGTYESTLSSGNGESEPVKYRLVYEDNGWKILGINILYSQQPPTKSLEITKVTTGTEVDLNGIITNPTNTINSTQGKVTVNVYVHNAVPGATIEAALEHTKTASRVAPVTTTLDQSGDSVVSFVFAPPTQGWPAGDYKLTISSSTGSKMTYNFKVE